MSSAPRIAPVILFDLDGTLADSASDLVAAVNDVRCALGLAPIAVEQIRARISGGAKAILTGGLPELPAAARESKVDALLQAYRGHIGQHGGLFPGIAAVLDRIETAGSRWGVVTNKHEDLARIVLERLRLATRCSVLIGGDTLTRNKPDPLPVTTACERLGVRASMAVFVGDDPRDVAAGRAAGTRTVAVRWGYHPPGNDPATWGADMVIDTPAQLWSSFALPV